jgi:very-short-patch-repair endonuclease
MNTVNWTPIRKQRVAGGRTINANYYAVTCLTPGCGYRRELLGCDARKAAANDQCQRCLARRRGRNGWRVMASRYGRRWAMRHVQAYRLDHPSTLEQRVAGMLDRLRIQYEREHALSTKASGRRKNVYLIDFMLSIAGEQIAVEVDGTFVHSQPASIKRDKLKTRLLKRRGFRLIRLSEFEILSGAAFSTLATLAETQQYIHAA